MKRKRRMTKRRYLREKLGFTQDTDWYQLTVADLHSHHGVRLLSLHSRSPALLVMRCLPHLPWSPWLFPRSSSNPSILNGPELSLCVSRMESELGIRNLSEWYRVGRSELAKFAQGFSGVGEFLSTTLKIVYPDHPWEVERFTQYSKGSVQRWLKVLLERFALILLFILFGLLISV